MPWCDGCDRFYNPNTLSPEGDCPEGHHVAEPAGTEPVPPVPWHFKLLVALAAVYLGWRIVQFVGAVVT